MYTAKTLLMVGLMVTTAPVQGWTCRTWCTSRPWTTALAAAATGDEDAKSEHTNAEILVTPETATYGVSFMGGDPCGSKYNDDPFDATNENAKPGIPDDVKARIAALAEQKKKEQEQKSN